MPVTLKDIAMRLKVTEQTVSRSLNGYSNISPPTVRKVQRVARELGYRPNLQAKRLRNQKTRTIGMLFPDVSYSYARDIIRGAQTVLRQDGYHPLIGLASWDPADVAREIEHLLGCRVEAMICQPVVGSEAIYRRVVEAGTPLIFVGNGLKIPGTEWVGLDGYDAGRKMMDHLLGLGHRRIALVATDSTEQSLSLGPIQLAYKDALREASIAVDPDLVCYSRLGEKASIEAMAGQLMALDAPPTAIFAVSDGIAYSLMDRLLRRGLRIPDDISIAGMGNLTSSALEMISLTTIGEDALQLGTLAARNVLAQLESPDRKRSSETIKGPLIQRRSTGRPGERPL
jgi:LacI family transcriptional regulator